MCTVPTPSPYSSIRITLSGSSFTGTCVEKSNCVAMEFSTL